MAELYTADYFLIRSSDFFVISPLLREVSTLLSACERPLRAPQQPDFKRRKHGQRLQKHRPGASIELLRKLIAITLLALFGLPFASSLLALTPKSDAGLPACCRRLGKHRCIISTQQRAQFSPNKTAIAAPQDKCPYAPTAMLGATHPTVFGLPKAQSIFAESATHPAGIPQTESRRRISLDRGRGKRGPPAVSLL